MYCNYCHQFFNYGSCHFCQVINGYVTFGNSELMTCNVKFQIPINPIEQKLDKIIELLEKKANSGGQGRKK